LSTPRRGVGVMRQLCEVLHYVKLRGSHAQTHPFIAVNFT
jgi:hypothetical protein